MYTAATIHAVGDAYDSIKGNSNEGKDTNCGVEPG